MVEYDKIFKTGYKRYIPKLAPCPPYNDKSQTFKIEYNILYNKCNALKSFRYEEPLVNFCQIYYDLLYPPFKSSHRRSNKFNTNFSNNIYNLDDKINSNLENISDKYSHYENRTAIWEIQYRSNTLRKPISTLIEDWVSKTSKASEYIDIPLSQNIKKIEINKISNFDFEEWYINLKNDIINLLKKHNKKISISDITRFLKHQNRDRIKIVCELIYNNNEIDFAGDGKYFIQSNHSDENKLVEE